MIAWFAAITVAAVDQLSKDLAAQPLRNSGYAFETVTGSRIALLAGTFLVMGAFAVLALRFAAPLAIPPVLIAVTLAGAASNALDRIVLGSVRDFVEIGNLVVNVADFAVFIGVVAIGIVALTHSGRLAASRERVR